MRRRPLRLVVMGVLAVLVSLGGAVVVRLMPSVDAYIAYMVGLVVGAGLIVVTDGIRNGFMDEDRP